MIDGRGCVGVLDVECSCLDLGYVLRWRRGIEDVYSRELHSLFVNSLYELTHRDMYSLFYHILNLRSIWRCLEMRKCGGGEIVWFDGVGEWGGNRRKGGVLGLSS